jgi:RND family efflux transporter MFP subunit
VKYDQRINPGMFAQVRLNTRTYQDVVSIPQEAIVEYRGTQVVYVVDKAIPDGIPQVTMREVHVGANVNGEVEIKNGLKAGESVVVQGQQFLSDGAAVRILGGAQNKL